jgi:ribokinase
VIGKHVVVVGSINMDLVATAERIPLAGETISGLEFTTFPGGKGANQAVAVARLGYPVNMIGRLGEDSFGDELQAHLKSAGVDTSGVKRVPGTSGVAVIVVSRTGQNCIVVIPGANDRLLPEDLDRHIEEIRSASLVLSQLEVPLDTVIRLGEICEREGVPLVLDPAPARPLPKELIRNVTWFTPNETEAEVYLSHVGVHGGPETSAGALLSLGARNIILKQGERGYILATADGSIESFPAFKVESVVDTTAAGDAFNGAFAVGLVTGSTPTESARFAAAAGAISVTRRGAQPSMPNREEVENLLATIRAK